jgi:hypothetical protein
VKHLLLVLALCLACGGSEAKKPVAPRAESGPPASSASEDRAPPNPPAAPLELALSVERTLEGVGLSVVNRGSAPVQLAQAVALERREGERHVSVAAAALALRRDCKSQGCVTLAPGGELLAPSWLDSADGERCGELVTLPAAGSYRFVVSACSGGATSEVSFVQSTPP